GKGFSRVETPLFASLLVQLQPQAKEEEDDEEQPVSPYDSTMPLLTTLMETYASLSQKVAELEQDKHTQALEILKLKKRVKQRMHPNRGKIEAIDVDEDITFMDVKKDEEVVTMDAEPQGRIDQQDVNAANKGVNATKPTVIDDEEVTMTMAWTLIKLKAEKAKLLDEQIAQKLHDEEVQKAAAKDKQEKDDIEREHFKGMSYDKVRPIFKWEYKKVQALFKHDKVVEEPKKKSVADETLLQESFKKLRATEVLGSESTQEIPSNDPKEMSKEDVQKMLEIVPVSEFKVEALQVKYPIIDWEIHTEGSRTYWKIIRVEKDYPLSNVVMILMLSAKLQAEEDNEMARDLVMRTSWRPTKQRAEDAWVDDPIIDEDEVIPEDETPELIEEFHNIDKQVPTIFYHERMEATLRDTMNNQFKDAEEYAYNMD
nr:hypothetical protein [Tanacetum cinerariifolium]